MSNDDDCDPKNEKIMQFETKSQQQKTNKQTIEPIMHVAILNYSKSDNK